MKTKRGCAACLAQFAGDETPFNSPDEMAKQAAQARPKG